MGQANPEPSPEPPRGVTTWRHHVALLHTRFDPFGGNVKTILQHLRDERAAAYLPAETAIAAAEAADRGLTPEETVLVETIAAELAPVDVRIADLIALEERNERASSEPRPGAAVVRSEPLQYSRNSAMNEKVSYFKDLATLAVRGQGLEDAEKRLRRHGVEMDVELPARANRRSDNAEREIRNLIGYDAPSAFEKRVNPNRTDGQGGYLVPPLWLMDELIPILRAGRTVANQVRNLDLPEGTDSINIPKLATGAVVDVQTADAAPVQSTDITDTFVTAGVKTEAGQQDVAIQLLEQSPLPIDEILFRDLIADYNLKVDKQVVAGTGINGQVQGLYSSAGASAWANYNQITWTTPTTQADMWTPMAQVLSKVAGNRFDLSNIAIFMHTRRWFWLASGLDTAKRPLIVPNQFGPMNAMGVPMDPASQGLVGHTTLGAPVFVDPNMPVADTAGGGTGQDVMFALKTDDALLFEGQLRQRALPEVLSGTLQVRFQVYNYIAFLLRYGQALSIASGAGFAAPSGF